jgi:hypothetical protein
MFNFKVTYTNVIKNTETVKIVEAKTAEDAIAAVCPFKSFGYTFKANEPLNARLVVNNGLNIWQSNIVESDNV